MDDYDIGLPSSQHIYGTEFEYDDEAEFEDGDDAEFEDGGKDWGADDIFDGDVLDEDKMNEIINEDTDGEFSSYTEQGRKQRRLFLGIMLGNLKLVVHIVKLF
ncbi:uncharacterized protein LOC133288338 [Gastrolobium bilobum]|uniref:uncharacterized protein LOC133288338 n=1 Tax=Gastrolobium bilobum TaxID=150636 RepID=UPI002AB1DA5A|nr:uncharacterized protein LOC133288338 [Gastrolobium bilobum]